jgi:D-alanine-D-alanine ligase
MSETAPASPDAPARSGRATLRAVVLSGGLNFEREVSLSSGTQVVEELSRAGLDAEVRDADADLLPGLAASPADAVFIALHGATGEDGALRAVLDLAGVPYASSAPPGRRRRTGSPCRTARSGSWAPARCST